MRIGVDVSVITLNQAGTGAYTSELVNAMMMTAPQHQYLPFAVDQRQDMSAAKTVSRRLDTLYRDMAWTHLLLPLGTRRAKVDILHMPAGVVPIFPSCPTVVTILDTTVLRMPASFTRWHRNYSRIFLPLSAKRATKILTISNHSKQDIVQDCGVPAHKVDVTYLAASPIFRTLQKAETDTTIQRYGLSRYLLTVGTLEPRKNIIRLLDAFSRLRRDDRDLMLVHAGPGGWLSHNVNAEIDRLGLKLRVRFLGRVPSADLVALYNGASVFVYPSLYEGFGLPILEAMACGCPVVTSNTSSMPEVAGDAAILIDPSSVDDIAAALQAVLYDNAVADDLRQRGLKRAKLFSWERCAEETLRVYQKAVDER